MKRLICITLTLVFFSCNSGYEFQDEQVYYRFWSFELGGWNEKLIEQADIKTFSELKSENNLYGKDKTNVYYSNLIIPGADPKTFKPLEKGFALDAKRVYYYNDSIANSRPENFNVIDHEYCKNNKNVFYKTFPLNVCSVEDFTFISSDKESVFGRWSTDGCFYYYNNFKVPSNDYQNIVVYRNSHGISRDNNNVYEFDKNYFETHSRQVFIKETGTMVKDTIDIKSFSIENNILTDKFGRIN